MSSSDLLTKIMNRANKHLACFKKIKYIKSESFQKKFIGLLIKYSSQKKTNWKDSTNVLMLKNDFENYDFLYLCQDAHNFGKSNDDII